LKLIFLACSVCFGDPNSLSSKAALSGVFFLLAVVLAVLGGIGWTALGWVRRSRKLQNHP